MKLTVNTQRIEVTDPSFLVTGTRGVYSIKFEFTKDLNNIWPNASVYTANFKKWKRDQVISVVLDEHNTCLLPEEMMTDTEGFQIGVFASVGGKDYNTVWSSRLAPDEGCHIGADPVEPTPSIWAQIIELVDSAQMAAHMAEGHAEQAVTAAENAAEYARESAEGQEGATAQANRAETEADNAEASADEAAASAASAGTSAANASASADEAEGYKNTAGTKAAEASTSASSASQSAATATTKAAEASTSASSAGQSATLASQKATEAGGYAGNAADSADEAEASATNAAQSATSASSSASSASASATSASTSATNASASASSASQSATEAQTYRDETEEMIEDLVAYDGDEPTDPLEINADQLDGHHASYFATSEDLTELQGEVVTAQSDIAVLQSNMATAQGSIATLQSDVATAKSNITGLQGNVSSLQSSVSSLSSNKMDRAVYDSGNVVASAGGIANYVDVNGGKIDHIQLNGVEQTITNKTVNLTIPYLTYDDEVV